MPAVSDNLLESSGKLARYVVRARECGVKETQSFPLQSTFFCQRDITRPFPRDQSQLGIVMFHSQSPDVKESRHIRHLGGVQTANVHIPGAPSEFRTRRRNAEPL